MRNLYEKLLKKISIVSEGTTVLPTVTVEEGTIVDHSVVGLYGSTYSTAPKQKKN